MSPTTTFLRKNQTNHKAKPAVQKGSESSSYKMNFSSLVKPELPTTRRRSNNTDTKTYNVGASTALAHPDNPADSIISSHLNYIDSSHLSHSAPLVKLEFEAAVPEGNNAVPAIPAAVTEDDSTATSQTALQKTVKKRQQVKVACGT